MSLRTELGKVRGLGAAKAGTHHWWLQRATAIALIPLAVWLIASLVSHVAGGHAVVTAWIGNPLVAVLLLLFVVAMFYHARLGLQVVIEDYVHDHGMKLAALLAVSFLAIAGGVAGVFAILKIAFGA